MKPNYKKALILAGGVALIGIFALNKKPPSDSSNTDSKQSIEWLKSLAIWAKNHNKSLSEQLEITIPWMKANEVEARNIDTQRGYSSFDWVASYDFNINSIKDIAANNAIS